MVQNLVSIIMLSHNHEEFVEESVRSILAQTYTNWELLFYDLNSKDDTVSRMVEFMALDKRIHVSKMVLSESISSCQNAALKEAKGQWVAFLNNGDLWEPEKLEWRYQVYKKVMKKNLLTAICMTFRSLWYASVKRIKYSTVPKS